MNKIKTGGGRFDPVAENHAYFIAANVERLHQAHQHHTHLLVAVNEINTDADALRVEKWLTAGARVFLDSGVFFLTTTFAQKTGRTMDEVLSLHPSEVEGFDTLLERYKQLVRRLEPDLWGYVEVDVGGRDNKIKTRTALEAEGLRPVPVYHPLLDGWDYFDELCQRYDRVCFGNVALSDRDTRRRLVTTAWERHRRYPDVWIHLLGFTPNEWLNALPVNSGDSSSWLSSVKYGAVTNRVMGASFGKADEAILYDRTTARDSERGNMKATRLAAVDSYVIGRNWINVLESYEAAGFNPYAPLEEGVKG